MGFLLGLLFHFLSESDRFTRGLVWASGPCLKFGVALLGLRLSVIESRRWVKLDTGRLRCGDDDAALWCDVVAASRL